MNSDQAGFTLLEVLMALVVISLSAVCLAQLIVGADSAWLKADKLSRGSEIAQEVMACELLGDPGAQQRVAAIQREAAAEGWRVDVDREPYREAPGCNVIVISVTGFALSITLDHVVRGSE